MSASHPQPHHAAQAEKLYALGQMAAGIAHDLNQSLALIAGYSDLARQRLEQGMLDAASAAETLRLVSGAAADGAEIVRRLLTFARHGPDVPPERVDIGALLREIAQLTAPRWRAAALAEGRPIRLGVEVDEGAGEIAIDGCAAGLREGLTNLIFNAVDALPDGGTIRLVGSARGEQVVVEVADSGIGMSAELRARIFEPFFTTKGERGTGLGLSMVADVVERHRGRIDVTSAPGQGTTFRLTFPAAAPASSVAEATPPASTASGPRLSILAVDDNRPLAEMAALMLSVDGHQVRIATSAEEALAHLAAAPIDVVVSDVGMGAGMNGWELGAVVRDHYPGVRFCLATGWAAQIDAGEARRRGVEAVIAKPYSTADLQRLVALCSAGD